MIAHGYASTAETTVLRPRRFLQVACAAFIAWVEERIVEGIVLQPCIVIRRIDVMTPMSSAEISEEERRNYQEWNWYDEPRG